MSEMLQGPQSTRDTTTSVKPTDITMTLNPYISIVTLNVNGLNAPTKRHRVSEWINKQDPSICCLQQTHFRPEDTFRLKVRGWRTIYHANGSQKKAGVAILISDKLDFIFFNMKFIVKFVSIQHPVLIPTGALLNVHLPPPINPLFILSF